MYEFDHFHAKHKPKKKKPHYANQVRITLTILYKPLYIYFYQRIQNSSPQTITQYISSAVIDSLNSIVILLILPQINRKLIFPQ